MTIVSHLLAAGTTPHTGVTFRYTLITVALVAAGLMVLYALVAIWRKRQPTDRARWSLWDKLLYGGTVVSVAVLSLTAFGAVFRYGTLEGWPLLAHMLGAGAFTVTLPLIAITWCEANRCCPRAPESETGRKLSRFFWLPKLTFWVLLASGLVATMTMLLSMLPVFGTEGLETLLAVHRYSGLVVATAVALHVFGVVLQRLGLR